jgi:capsular polysaccharide biosynthesis protein
MKITWKEVKAQHKSNIVLAFVAGITTGIAIIYAMLKCGGWL